MTHNLDMGVLENLKAKVRATPFYAPVWRHNFRANIFRSGRGSDWRALLDPVLDQWEEARRSAAGPRVLIATNIGAMHAIGLVDSLIAVALTLRGARVEFLVCDGVLPACQLIDHSIVPSPGRLLREGPQPDFCGPCAARADARLDPLNLPVHRLGSWIDEVQHAQDFSDVGAPDEAELKSDPVAAHALAGVLRFHGLSAPLKSPDFNRLHARYLNAARRAAAAFEALADDRDYDVVLAHHGVYVPQGPVAEIARQRGIRLVTWHPSYLERSILLQHGDTYHRAMLNEPKARWDRPLTDAEDRRLSAYLVSRESPSRGWVNFQRAPVKGNDAVMEALQLDPTMPIDLLIANVSWDARLHYDCAAYAQMADWACETIEWYRANPKRQLVVRCHPGEVVNQPRSQEMLHAVIADRIPSLPQNVRIVPARDEMNTYDLAQAAERFLVYATKMAVELAAAGRPVIVAGEAWIRNKGFSFDADTPAQYVELLADPRTKAPLESAATALARRYAYHFFFRRCIPIDALTKPNLPDVSRNVWDQVQLSDNSFQLAGPGGDLGLEVVCAGILSGTAFEYEAHGAEAEGTHADR